MLRGDDVCRHDPVVDSVVVMSDESSGFEGLVRCATASFTARRGLIVMLVLKQAIPPVRGRFAGRDRLDEGSTRFWGR